MRRWWRIWYRRRRPANLSCQLLSPSFHGNYFELLSSPHSHTHVYNTYTLLYRRIFVYIPVFLKTVFTLYTALSFGVSSEHVRKLGFCYLVEIWLFFFINWMNAGSSFSHLPSLCDIVYTKHRALEYGDGQETTNAAWVHLKAQFARTNFWYSKEDLTTEQANTVCWRNLALYKIKN